MPPTGSSKHHSVHRVSHRAFKSSRGSGGGSCYQKNRNVQYDSNLDVDDEWPPENVEKRKKCDEETPFLSSEDVRVKGSQRLSGGGNSSNSAVESDSDDVENDETHGDGGYQKAGNCRGITLGMWYFGQCDSKKCSGMKLYKLGKIKVFKPCQKFYGIILRLDRPTRS